jgi:Zn-dependent peptidase ImmA (M78 family)
MPTRVPVAGELLRWARERSRLSTDGIAKRFPQASEWEAEAAHPTLRQLEEYARTTHTPIGYFFLAEPPTLRLPIPDFRTRGDGELREPSPELLDTIYDCQQRQDWFRDYAIVSGFDRVAVVSTKAVGADVTRTAAEMRRALDFETGQRGHTWDEAFRTLAEHAEALGVLVMASGIVGSNTHRKLDPDEFGGFSLVDEYAPVVFVNGADTKAAQVFTLAHELAHIWSGEPGVGDARPSTRSRYAAERWCNAVAAEMLVPTAALVEQHPTEVGPEALDKLAARFRTSTLVILLRLRDIGVLDPARFSTTYEEELRRVRQLAAERHAGTGGNYYNTQPVRTSKRFARALITDTLEGNTLYRDAFHMLGLKKQTTFDHLADRLGVG